MCGQARLSQTRLCREPGSVGLSEAALGGDRDPRQPYPCSQQVQFPFPASMAWSQCMLGFSVKNFLLEEEGWFKEKDVLKMQTNPMFQHKGD